MFKFYIQKCCIRRTFSSETKQNFQESFSPIFKYTNLDVLWSVSNQGPHDPHLSTLTNRLQRHFNIYTKKTFFPKLQKSDEILEIQKKTEIGVFRISKKSI